MISEPADRSPGSDAAIVHLRGELDLASAPAVEVELLQAERLGVGQIVLDCRQLEFIDSSGIKVLAAANQRATRAGRSVVLVNVPDRARRVFDVAGLTGWLTFA